MEAGMAFQRIFCPRDRSVQASCHEIAGGCERKKRKKTKTRLTINCRTVHFYEMLPKENDDQTRHKFRSLETAYMVRALKREFEAPVHG